MKQEDEFISILEQHKGLVFKVANSYCKNGEDRKDLVQEIIIQLWKSFDDYDNNFKYSTWIYRISLNVAISFYRKENSRKRISNPMGDDILNFADGDNPEEKEADLGILQGAISQLNDLDKALMLLYLEEKNYQEISDIIGISKTNVATKIGRIKPVLKEKFIQLKNQ